MSSLSRFALIRNGESFKISQIPEVPISDFRADILKMASSGKRLCALILNGKGKNPTGLLSVLSDDAEGKLYLNSSEPVSSYPALTPDLPQAHLFEREIYENSGIVPEGHPWLKPVRRKPADEAIFFKEDGEEIHEVAVGPIHAGIIEPGHFRFQCHGEAIHHLEIQLGYQYRGAEALLQKPNRFSLSIAESICGDSAIAHGWAHCRALEALQGIHPTLKAEALRAILLETERLANHMGDLGAISGDIGYLPASAYFGRLRGDFLNLLMLISGNRYGKGFLELGGAAFDIPPQMRSQAIKTLQRAKRHLAEIGEMFFSESSVISRLEETGVISQKVCADLGLVGVAARASGKNIDVRQDHPYGLFRFRYIPTVKLTSGDVFARAMIRFLESQRSLDFLSAVLDSLPEGDLTVPRGKILEERLSVSLIEGWRGEVCHIAFSNAEGKLSGYKVIDPSFHNWMAVAISVRQGEISDFPLCNKSFNLSYAGHDL